MTTTPTDVDVLRQQLKRLGLWGLLTNLDEIATADWLPRVIAFEEAERSKRSLQRRLKSARLGNFKPMADFNWSWPRKIDREMLEELFTLRFVTEGTNVLLVGPNGIGKTMIAQNLAHQAVVRGQTVRFTMASDMLNELAAQESDASFSRRLRRYCHPHVLCIDEVGYLSYDARYADLLFEVVTRRCNERKPIILTTNKPFNDWPEVFPNAGCVVTLVDRLVHRSEIIQLQGASYRLHEAAERAKLRAKKRRTKKSEVAGTKPVKRTRART
jgi:DNA replication protein DnaC